MSINFQHTADLVRSDLEKTWGVDLGEGELPHADLSTRNTYGLSNKAQESLTTLSMAAILALLSPHVIAGIRPPRIGQNTRPLLSVVFYCPSKRCRKLFRHLLIMVGCIEQPVKRLAGAYAGRSNLIHPTAQRLDPVSGGNHFYIGLRHATK
jgi:hypothetical protein